eukprot:c20401_g1_i1 orf=213-1646(-)
MAVHRAGLAMVPLLALFPSLLIVSAAFFCFICFLRRGKIQPRSVGFFHPYTNDGGGGERVLWCAVRAVQEELPDISCVIYTGDDATPESLAARALDRFGVRLPSLPLVVQLQKRWWVEAATYPNFTLIGQSLGSIVLAWEALSKLTPVLFFDTSGYAFTYPLARAFGCKVVCYTHYPTISCNMLSRVLDRATMYNNNDLIAGSLLLSLGKVLYYKLFAWIYGIVGRYTQLAIVNSSWTQSHIETLWNIPERTFRVYPPCDTSALQALPLKRCRPHGFFISIAQFRPEKAQKLQLEAFAIVLKRLHAYSLNHVEGVEGKPRLKLIGSCRNVEDEERVQKLKELCFELGIEEQVDFCVNVAYKELIGLLAGAMAGLHSMIDEHFGIVIVEYMAAGAIPIAHNSGGPKMDIVLDDDGEATGFLATTLDEFAAAMYTVLTMTEEQWSRIALAARRRASLFSEQRFSHDFKNAMGLIFTQIR